MKTERQILVTPIIVLIILIALLGALYYYAGKGLSASDSATTTTDTSEAIPGETNQTATAYPLVSPATGNTVQVSNQGVLAQRLGWKTFTNTAYSYALSYPPIWQLLSGSTLASMTDGTASVSVQSFNLTPNTTASMLASESGVSNGFETTVNAYDATEAFQGSNTVYFIVNGSVGYEITVPTSPNENDANVIRAMLLTFTTTKAR